MILFSQALAHNDSAPFVQFSPPPIQFSRALERHSSGRVALAAAYYKKREPVIRSFHAVIRRHLDYAKHETLRNLEEKRGRRALGINSATSGPGGVGADIIFDRARFADGLLAALRNESADAVQTAGDQFFQEIGRNDPWSMPDPLLRPFLDTRDNLLRDVPDEIFAQIEQEISAGLDAGESIRQISKRISDVFDGISTSRATTIASTETGAAYGFARQVAMQDAGVRHKSWLTSHLPNVRPAHQEAELNPANHGIPIDQAFQVGGEALLFPGDEHGSPENIINCHCVALSEA